MYRLTWDRLSKIEKDTAPYRGTTNRYPIGNRSQNTKCFYVDEIDGEKVYRITYSYRLVPTYHTKEEWEEDLRKNGKDATINEWTSEQDVSKRYRSYKRVPYELGVVRSDNTFEFTANKGYGQGDNIIMSGMSSGFFSRDSRRGGMVYQEYSNGTSTLLHPVFKGLRVYCDTMQPHPSSEYKVIGNRVDRKASKVFTDKYKEFYRVNEVMFKVLEWQNILDTAKDVFESCGIDGKSWYLPKAQEQKLIYFADKYLNTSPLESCVAYAVAYDISSFYAKVRSYIEDSNNAYYHNEQGLSLFDAIKRRLNKNLFMTHPEVFKEVELVSCNEYPRSEWGVKILVNGKEVEQY